MSTLWTPGGEHPVGRADRTAPTTAPTATGDTAPNRPAAPAGEISEEEAQAAMAELRQRLADAPAEVVVANHAYGLFELAALHLSLQPPNLDGARLAIDALGALVEGLTDRLGPAYPELNDGLAQLRMAYVQLTAALRGRPPGPPSSAGAESPPEG